MFRWLSIITLCSLLAVAGDPEVVVLGIAQDAGFPQAGCKKTCCKQVIADASLERLPTCLAVLDGEGGAYLLEATPAFPKQLQRLSDLNARLSGIFLTHGHMGHYTGLMHLGREVMGAQGMPVYVMPRMQDYLTNHGPWSQLVRLNNIALKPMQADVAVALNNGLRITPFLVPHRDEYTETVGYLMEGPNKRIAFIPDIDKWSRWERPIEDLIQQVDLAYVDGTFFEEGEIPGRNMAEIPHPFVAETMARLKDLPPAQRARVRFIHFNHTNPILEEGGEAPKRVVTAGFTVAKEGERVGL